jgi:hypothetical protein
MTGEPNATQLNNLLSGRKKTMCKFLLFCFVMLGIAACTKQSPVGEDQYITLEYQQTQCSDKWAYATSDSLQLAAVAHFLDSAGLYVASLNIRQQQLPMVCNACTCLTGKVIEVTTLNSDSLIAQYTALGFR